jgi:hypothetical protein
MMEPSPSKMGGEIRITDVDKSVKMSSSGRQGNKKPTSKIA